MRTILDDELAERCPSCGAEATLEAVHTLRKFDVADEKVEVPVCFRKCTCCQVSFEAETQWQGQALAENVYRIFHHIPQSGPGGEIPSKNQNKKP